MTSADTPTGAPPTLRDWLALCRVSNLPTVWMNVLAAQVLAVGGLHAGSFALLVLACSAFYTAGMCWNDVFDRDWDATARPERPIPSGRIALPAARFLGTLLLVAGLSLLLLAPHPSSLAAGVGLVALILAYDYWHKAHPITVLAMAGCRVGVFVVTAWAMTGGVPAAVWAGAAASFAHTLGVTVVARIEGGRADPFPLPFPLVPALIAAMSITDGIVLALFASPWWLVAGAVFAALTWLGQRYVRGD